MLEFIFQVDGGKKVFQGICGNIVYGPKNESVYSREKSAHKETSFMFI